jgi:hypothetical protein
VNTPESLSLKRLKFKQLTDSDSAKTAARLQHGEIKDFCSYSKVALFSAWRAPLVSPEAVVTSSARTGGHRCRFCRTAEISFINVQICGDAGGSGTNSSDDL